VERQQRLQWQQNDPILRNIPQGETSEDQCLTRIFLILVQHKKASQFCRASQLDGLFCSCKTNSSNSIGHRFASRVTVIFCYGSPLAMIRFCENSYQVSERSSAETTVP